ncbi:MAG: hypothetical protein NTU41_11095, partial [Chloroflexi bacterium]|nr:hypothetical protein [Chloroflexota bacterium]
AGSREVWEVMLEQAGAIGVDTLDEMVDMVVTLSFLPLPGGKNAAIVTGGGGASVLATDACAMNGFRVPPVPESVAAMFRSHRETDVGFILTNPVELNMFPELSFEMAKELLAHHDFDLLLANCVFGQQPWPMFAPWYELFCSNVVKVSTVCHKPIAVVLHVTLQSLRQQAMDLQRRYVDAGLPVYYSVAAACRAIDRLMRHHAKRLAKTRLS